MNNTVSHGPRRPRQTRHFQACLWTCAVTLCLSLSGGSASAADGVNFSLPGLDGKTYELESFRGKWVVVNFWATWCGTCIEEMDALQSFADANAHAQVLAVNFEEIAPDVLAAFVKDLKIDFPVLLVAEQPLVPIEPLKGLPTTAIVNPAGKMVAHHTGAVTRDALERFIAAERARP